MAMAFAPDKVKSEAAKKAVYRLISQTKTIATDDDAEKPKLSDAAGDICFEGVTFSYPTRPDRLVFKDLSLVIPAGKQTALVGATGCGKSSCVALLQRFYDPSAGRRSPASPCKRSAPALVLYRKSLCCSPRRSARMCGSASSMRRMRRLKRRAGKPTLTTS